MSTVQKLAKPRDSTTCHGLIMIPPPKDHEDRPPEFIIVHERGDLYRYGKGQFFSIPGGSTETFMNVRIGPRVFEDLLERSLIEEGFTSLSLNGEEVVGDKTLSCLLRQYPFGIEIPATFENDYGEAVKGMVTPLRDETEEEAVVREVGSETDILCQIIPQGATFNATPKLKIPMAKRWEENRFGAVRYERCLDKHYLRTLHHRYLFLLERKEGKYVGRIEAEETDWVAIMALDALTKKLFSEELASGSNEGYGNKQGFSHRHGLYLLSAFKILGIDFEPWIPEYINPNLPAEYIMFLPPEKQEQVLEVKKKLQGKLAGIVKPDESVEKETIQLTVEGAVAEPVIEDDSDDPQIVRFRAENAAWLAKMAAEEETRWAGKEAGK